MKEEFYTRSRWLNWLNQIRESEFTLPESEEGGDVAAFVYIMDDVVLACLKVIARCEREIITKEDAISEINTIREIVSEGHESLGEDADLMLDSLKTSLAAVFVSCERYISGNYDREPPLSEFVKKAIEAEENEQIDSAVNILSEMGARVIGGEDLPVEALDDLPYCMVAELLDGIDAISAAMIGDDSYKEDDGTVSDDF
jgi:hypothetical protein